MLFKMLLGQKCVFYSKTSLNRTLYKPDTSLNRTIHFDLVGMHIFIKILSSINRTIDKPDPPYAGHLLNPQMNILMENYLYKADTKNDLQ